MVQVGSGVWRSSRTGRAVKAVRACGWRSFFDAAAKAHSHQEAVGGDGQRNVTVEAAPVAPLVVTAAELPLQFLIIALDTSTQFDQSDQLFAGNTQRQHREPVVGRFGFGQRRFETQAFFLARGHQ